MTNRKPDDLYNKTYDPLMQKMHRDAGVNLAKYLHAMIKVWCAEHGMSLLGVIAALEQLDAGYCEAARAAGIDDAVLRSFRAGVRGDSGKEFWEKELEPLLRKGLKKTKKHNDDTRKSINDDAAIRAASAEGRVVKGGDA